MPPDRSKSWMPDKDGLLLISLTVSGAVSGAVSHHVYPLPV
jgi:hypothetical protein